jgi:glycosyltransferase XagB
MTTPGIDPASLAYAARAGVQCARVRWTGGQIALACLLPIVALAALLRAPETTWMVGSLLVAALAAATVGLRLVAMLLTAQRDPTLRMLPAELAVLDRATLPRYSVLVPLYREPEVVPHLLAALEALDYPRDRLDVQILVEPDDDTTRAALAAHTLPAWLRITIAPEGLPRTKPRACNTGLAAATGDLLVIFDAEDRPEPDQMLKAVAAYARLGPEVVCLQCRLDHYNSQQSLATRWATIDYLVWFRLVLPGLQRLGAPLPLGGTSNHFRIAALRELGGWDPFNVTEDADLGLRIARRGWRTCMLASTTWEEAVTTMPAWVRQRSRWIKGHLQTWMVHSRRGALRAFGLRGYLLMALGTAGLMATLLINPLAWAVVLLWLALGWSIVDAHDPWSVAGLVVSAGLLLANLLLVAISVAACLGLRRRDLLAAAVQITFAWVLQSLAAWRAAWEFIARPFHWEKTRHGQAVADGTAGWRHGALIPLTGAAGLAVAVVLLAGMRIRDDIRRQDEMPVPVQLALRFVPAASTATGLVAAENAQRAPAWQVVPAIDAPACPVTIPALRATADFPTAALELTSHAPRDLGMAAALACDVLVDADAPRDLRLTVHWRDEDGRWFQQLSPQRLLPGAWTRLEFAVQEPDGWQGLDHARAWHPDLLRRVSELGLAFHAAQRYHGTLTVANLRTLPLEDAPAPACTMRNQPPSTLPVLQRWRLDADLGRSWTNPFDPDEVAVDAEFTTPSGAIERVPAYYFQDYTRRLAGGVERIEALGAPCWRADYRPRQAGRHAWRLLLSERGAAAAPVVAGSFTATPAAGSGFLRRSVQHPELLARDDGSFAYLIGQNLVQAVDRQQPFPYPFAVPPDQGTFTYDRYVARMSGAGMNIARLWMTPWSFGLEGHPQWRDFHGLGRYNLANAWRLDHVFDEAGRQGIDILLTVSHQSEFNTKFGSLAWLDSALNRDNGGFMRTADAFFTEPRVLDAYRKRMRYLVARWGDRTNLAAWEIFGEANLLPSYDPAACATWHQAIIDQLRSSDVYRHLIFTHTHNWQEGHLLWALPGIDCVQGNGYIRPPNRSTNHVRNFDRYLAEVAAYRKPVLVAEYGGRSEQGAPSADYLEAQLHSGLWASLVRPFAGAALHWWWNFTDGADLYGHYRGLSRFAAGIDRLERDYRPVDPQLRPAAGLAVAGMQAADAGFYWVHDPAIFEQWDGLPARPDAALVITGLRPGRYHVEFWDTMAGSIRERREVEITGETIVALPAVTGDLAVKILPLPGIRR